MADKALSLASGYIVKAVNRLKRAQPNEIFPLIKNGVSRLLVEMRSGQSIQIIPLLQDYLARANPGQEAPTISRFMPCTTGWENETYSFTLARGPAKQRKTEEFMLCIYPGSFAHKRANSEYQALTRLYQAGYPVPMVKHYEQDGDPLSHFRPFMVTECVQGHRMGKALTDSTGVEREKLLSVFCGLLARLHSFDWRMMTDDPSYYLAYHSRNTIDLSLAESQADVQCMIQPGLQPGWQWILDHGHEITSPGLSFVHFDFHPNNIILREHVDPASGGAVVIDWTGASITDYRFDLAWTLLLVCSYIDGKLRDPIIKEYERQSGRRVEDIEFFEAVACFSRLLRLCCLITQKSEQSGYRAGTEKQILGQAPIIKHTYERFLQFTGCRIPEVEEFLNSVKA